MLLSSLEMNPQSIQNNWRMFNILLVDWSANFAMDQECEKLRMKKTTNELASLISSLNLGIKKMPIEEYVQLAREEIVDVEYNMIELMDLAWVDKSIWLKIGMEGQ